MGVKKFICLLLVAPVLSTGCSGLGGFEVIGSDIISQGSSSGSGNDSGSVSEEFEMAALDKNVVLLDASLLEVEQEIAKIDLQFLGSSSSSGTQEGLDKKVKALFAKLYGAIENVHLKAYEIRSKVNEQLAKLDPTNPLHLAALIKLQEYLKYLDELENKVDEAILKLSVKVNDIVARLDSKVAELDPSKPATWAIMYFWQQIKVELVDFKVKLENLAKS